HHRDEPGEGRGDFLRARWPEDRRARRALESRGHRRAIWTPLCPADPPPLWPGSDGASLPPALQHPARRRSARFGAPQSPEPGLDPPMIRSLRPNEAQSLIEDTEVDVVDVRGQREWLAGHLPRARLVPLDELRADPKGRLTRDKVLFVCA